jgi:predicted O-methyltransferase YrrM
MTFQESMKYAKLFLSQTHPGEAEELYRAVTSTPPGDVIEVGSATGGTTIILIGAAEEVGKRVISCDPYPSELEGIATHFTPGIMNAHRNDFQRNIFCGEYGKWANITQWNGTVRELLSLARSSDHISVAFIDSLHELAPVQEEFTLLLPLVVPGGLIYIHDTDWELGQLSHTPEGGLINFASWVDETPFDEVGRVGSMWYGRKKREGVWG